MTLPMSGTATRFRLHGPVSRIETEGCLAQLPPGPARTLGARVDAFFAGARASTPLVGALPFDPHEDDALYQPLRRLGTQQAGAHAAARVGHIHAEPTEAAYADAVARVVERLRAADGDDALRKLVLARSLRMDCLADADPLALALRLGDDPSVTSYVVPLPVETGEAPAWLVGATPELLVSRRGRQVLSHPLAGSARRQADPVADAATADALLGSVKDLDEHRYVVEAIVEALAPLCSQLHAPARPALHATATMWHLGTRIEGTLKDPATSAAALAGLLHPTPAVCGTPRLPALEAIRTLEPVPRGFYAGAVGWSDAQGDGDWYVSIRCARVQGRVLRLYAGAGIVAASQPSAEVEETSAKFMALLNALGLGEATAAA